MLYIAFESDDREEFLKNLNSGAYILPGESVEYADEGLRFLTENEKKTLKDWVRGNKAIYAYVLSNAEKDREELFGNVP